MDWETLKKRLLAAERIGFGRTVAVNVMDLTDAVMMLDKARAEVERLKAAELDALCQARNAEAEVERLRAVLRKIVHREHLFAKAHVAVQGKIDRGACAGCTAEEALNG